ncbi:hypothetical protein HanRHA438_Chr05g0239001 [Helianthus annuus]|uniref:Uncharacterized protein n=1 Tax=Helianthus annuus TaxID=4232 RepID=A0A251UT43_HELAN|nr:hypothetical protein HanXRQr2_Chr05g0229941 [Helianthus annuus]KAJ0585641.1 hypothetical protein HanHA89_Chr05g0203061 [Helianthus annuus]KAJ0920225.1 hypothetical protein HanRHA438_Chr05g0239001 [Helianthus annuus]KAJ0923878.1 hypothetical protein HanPSC8_Chr05g0221791 [Helianthus annuus]
MHFTSMNSISPSFTGNSSSNLADIAARVVEEFRNQNNDEEDNIYSFTEDANQVYVHENDRSDRNYTENLKRNEEEEEEEGDEEEFEFAVVCRNPSLSPVSADEIFSNGEILPRYPLFDRSLLLNDVVSDQSDKISVTESVRQPLGKLFKEERESASCTTSSEADNLAGVTPGTYCIWKPKEESPERCKKSNSTGNTSKRWRLRNLLQRSNSDSRMTSGKHAPVADFGNFPATKKKGEKVKKVDKTAKVAGADDDGELTSVTDEIKSANKGNNRFRSYLRHKKDNVGVYANVSGGVFANVSGLSRNA